MQQLDHDPDDDTIEDLPVDDQLVVAAVVKSAFGVAIGTVCALGLGGFAAVCVLGTHDRGAETFARLIGTNFLPGYAPTWTGVFVGLVWGFSGGYLLGFATALARNRMLKFLFWIEATRARLNASRTVLDDLM